MPRECLWHFSLVNVRIPSYIAHKHATLLKAQCTGVPAGSIAALFRLALLSGSRTEREKEEGEKATLKHFCAVATYGQPPWLMEANGKRKDAKSPSSTYIIHPYPTHNPHLRRRGRRQAAVALSYASERERMEWGRVAPPFPFIQADPSMHLRSVGRPSIHSIRLHLSAPRDLISEKEFMLGFC